jgi:hypothetical protein
VTSTAFATEATDRGTAVRSEGALTVFDSRVCSNSKLVSASLSATRLLVESEMNEILN